MDNARALVTHQDAATREMTFNGRFLAFARDWGFRPRACAPCRARTKGEDERGVGYGKRNAIAGHRFAWLRRRWRRIWRAGRARSPTSASMARPARRRWSASRAMLVERSGLARRAAALRPLSGRPRFRQIRELTQVVQADGCAELDTNRYEPRPGG